MHGAPARFADPARFSFAHGGKDGHPFPVPLDVYDQTIAVLRRAIGAARLGNDEKLAAIRRLDDRARAIEAAVDGPPLEALIERERIDAPRWGGRTVHDRPTRREASARGRQLRLF